MDSLDEFRPTDIPLDDWIRMFISLGFLVATSENNLPQVKQIAEAHGLSTVVIGQADDSKTVKLRLGNEECIFIDFSESGVFTPKNLNT